MGLVVSVLVNFSPQWHFLQPDHHYIGLMSQTPFTLPTILCRVEALSSRDLVQILEGYEFIGVRRVIKEELQSLP